MSAKRYRNRSEQRAEVEYAEALRLIRGREMIFPEHRTPAAAPLPGATASSGVVSARAPSSGLTLIGNREPMM